MPAPSASQMKNMAKALYGQQFGKEGEEYMDMLFDGISSAWDVWQKGIVFGGLLVAGGGVGGWSGVGNGGVMTAQPFVLKPFSFKSNSPQQLKFTNALANALKAKFAPFPMSFKFSGVNYVGTSGASPTSPGPVSATCVSVPLVSAGKGEAPSGIANAWKAELTPPEFQLSNPNAKSGDLVKAIASAIEQSFQTVWLTSTMISANSMKTSGAPGGVVAGFSTESNGKLV